MGLDGSAWKRTGTRPAWRAAKPGLDRQAHGPGHGRGVVRPVDRGRHEHAVAAELHGQRGVRRGPDSRIEDDRDVDRIAQQRDVVRVPQPEPAADRASREASPPRTRPVGDGRRARGRRSCTAAPRNRPRPTARPPPAARPHRASSVRSLPMTSSLTQSVANASRASFAVSTASPAVAQPAVFGSTRTSSSCSSESSEPRPDASTLLTATVAMAAPDSTRAVAQRMEARHAAGAEEEA